MRPNKHWMDHRFLAPNVREVEFAFPLIERLQPFVDDLRARPPFGEITLQGLNFFHLGRCEWGSDIGWISGGDEECHAFFEELFHQTGLAETMASHIDCDREVRLYSGFFVTRSRCAEVNLHVDWRNGDNQGLTFMAALSDDAGAMPMVYRTARGSLDEYSYPLGKGLVFGDWFVHSTGPGHTERQTVLLCFNFGTDRMEDWPPLARTCAGQSRLHRRPDGAFVRRDPR